MVQHGKCENGPTKKPEVHRLKTYPPPTHTQTVCKGWEKECVFCNFYCLGNYPQITLLIKGNYLLKATRSHSNMWYGCVYRICS